MALISLSRIVSHWADRRPEAIAVAHDNHTITWTELENRTNKLARAYQSLSVGPDDFVTIALPNSIEFFESSIATWKLGATPQPVSAKLPKMERDAIVEIGRPMLVVGVADGEHGHVALLVVGQRGRMRPRTLRDGAKRPSALAGEQRGQDKDAADETEHGILLL